MRMHVSVYSFGTAIKRMVMYFLLLCLLGGCLESMQSSGFRTRFIVLPAQTDILRSKR